MLRDHPTASEPESDVTGREGLSSEQRRQEVGGAVGEEGEAISANPVCKTSSKMRSKGKHILHYICPGYKGLRS